MSKKSLACLSVAYILLLPSEMSFISKPFEYVDPKYFRLEIKGAKNEGEERFRQRIRDSIVASGLKTHNVYIFGKPLAELEKTVFEGYRKADPGKKIEVSLEVPKNFLVPQNYEGEVDLTEKKFSLFQNIPAEGGIERILLEKSDVVVGGKNWDYRLEKYRDFSTPEGVFRISYLVLDPVWYPPLWAKENAVEGVKKVLPGKRNPFGKWLAPLCNEKGEYTRFGIHLSQNFNKNSFSHRCIRLPPDKGEKIFSGLKHHLSKDSGLKNKDRGMIYRLKNPIKVKIHKKS